MSTASNLTVEERIRYGDYPQEFISILEESENNFHERDKFFLEEKRHAEIAEEQVYFARNLIEAIQDAVSDCTTAKDLKKAIRTAIANSSFEL